MKDEMDILKEVGTTAAAHGSTALSEIIGRQITLSLPSIDILSRNELPDKINIEGMTVSTQTQILSGLKGKIIFILEEQSAFRLVDICYKTGDQNKKISLFTEMGISVIKEIGNIIISSYINSLGVLTRKLIIPSFPVLINAPFNEIVLMLTENCESDDKLLVIRAVFEAKKEKIKGNFWLVLTADAAEEIKRICKEMVSSHEV